MQILILCWFEKTTSCIPLFDDYTHFYIYKSSETFQKFISIITALGKIFHLSLLHLQICINGSYIMMKKLKSNFIYYRQFHHTHCKARGKYITKNYFTLKISVKTRGQVPRGKCSFTGIICVRQNFPTQFLLLLYFKAWSGSFQVQIN